MCDYFTIFLNVKMPLPHQHHTPEMYLFDRILKLKWRKCTDSPNLVIILKIADITHFKLIFHKNIFSSPKICWISPFLLISPKICWFSALNVGKVVRVPICSCTRQICRFCPIYVGFLPDIGNFGHFVLASPKNLLFPPLILIWLTWFTTKTPRYSIFARMFRKRECCLVACK